MSKQAKPCKAWAVVDPAGHIVVSSIRIGEEKCRIGWVRADTVPDEWTAKWEAWGYTIQRVTITPEAK